MRGKAGRGCREEKRCETEEVGDGKRKRTQGGDG